ncbi:hypothetical protein [Lentibacillus salicampi]|uniref:Atypical membrane-integrating protein (Mistic protein) n=1 Tax=Lentibacillus salicampi TaxID=175306 RepID=A0A4Y9A9E0_9BACI|nr:hypothetical protein [Lentibacillus salicampi]TFJ92496.1 hypothetical protein E4U82_11760 [Lentibacillus salicampi]
MKASEMETKRFDKALDEILDLFNNLEEDKPVIQFDTGVLENIERAKRKYGSDIVDEKINTVVHEMLSWLDLDDVETEEEEEDNTNTEE